MAKVYDPARANMEFHLSEKQQVFIIEEQL